MSEIKPLFDLTIEEVELQNEIANLLDRDDPEAAAKFDELLKVQMDTEEKAARMIRVMQNLEHTANVRQAIYDSAKSLLGTHRDAAKSALGKIERIKSRLVWHMRETRKDKIETSEGVISLTRNGGNAKVVVPMNPDFTQWPDEFYRTEIVPDEDAIRAAHEAGRPIPAGVEVFRGYHIRIK